MSDIESKEFNKIKISSLFDEEPRQWGLRGDPFLWDEMRLKSIDKTLLETEEMMQKYFYLLFYELTGIEINSNKDIRLEKYYYGSGMSGGIVSSGFWLGRGIPFILERYKKIQDWFNGIEYKINDVYWLSEHYKGFNNSIEHALKRSLLFEEVNIKYIFNLLSADGNIGKISKEIKNSILEYLRNEKDIKHENVSELIDLFENN